MVRLRAARACVSRARSPQGCNSQSGAGGQTPGGAIIACAACTAWRASRLRSTVRNVKKNACPASCSSHLSQQPRYFALQSWERTGSTSECGSYGFQEASGVPSLQGLCNPVLCRGLLHRRLEGLLSPLAALHSLREFEKTPDSLRRHDLQNPIIALLAGAAPTRCIHTVLLIYMLKENLNCMHSPPRGRRTLKGRKCGRLLSNTTAPRTKIAGGSRGGKPACIEMWFLNTGFDREGVTHSCAEDWRPRRWACQWGTTMRGCLKGRQGRVGSADGEL